jgi:hypothetical protein
MRSYAHKSRKKAARRMSELDYALHLEKLGKAATAAAAVPVKRTKYGSEKVYHEGMKFDSKHELRCWLNLVALAERGEITELRRQVAFKLLDAVDLGEKRKKRAAVYIADFVFIDSNGKQVVQDAKSSFTKKLAEYRLKKHMMADLLGIVVEEV